MKKRKDMEQQAALIQWMRDGLPEDSNLPSDLRDEYERLVRADQLMSIYMSVPVVAGMLVEHYGYSMDTARRDIREAQNRLGELDSHPKSYYAKMMMDKIGECLNEAVQDRKWREVAALSKELRDWTDAAEKARITDPALLKDSVPRVLVFAPEQLGHVRNPNILEEARLVIEEKIGKPFAMPDFPETPAHLMPGSDDEEGTEGPEG